MTAVKLKSLTRKELADLAKRDRISGWHGMKKEELVEALLKQQRKDRRRARRKGRNGTAAANRPSNGTPAKNGTNGIHRELTPNGRGQARDLSGRHRPSNGTMPDGVEARADDAYWIHVRWRFSPAAILRAEAALGFDWHRALPVIRLFDVTTGDAEGPDCRTQVRDIEIHGDVNHWHVPVDHPGRTYRLHIGYRTPGGRFHLLGRSRGVKMPQPGASGDVDHSWKQQTKQAQAVRRNGGYRHQNGRHNGERENGDIPNGRSYPFHVDAELIVHGSTHPQAELTLLGERVELSKEGRFSLRFALPNGRQVIPAVTVSPSGEEQHTIVLAVERNTRELEPQPMDELL